MPANFEMDEEENQPGDSDPGTISIPRSEPLIQPLPYSTKGIRGRLFVLFALLLLVLVAMKEAGKPENWEWMGFKKENEISLENNSNDDPAVAPHPDRSKLGNAPLFKSDPNESNSSPSLRIQSESTPAPLPEESLDYPQAAVRFWRTAYPNLRGPWKSKLMQITRKLRRGSEVEFDRSDESLRTSRQMLEWLSNERDQFHQQLFDQITLTPDRAPNKAQMNERYYACEDIWEKDVLPALKSLLADEDITIGQQQTILRLQNVLDYFVLQEVQDKSAIGWSGDTEAWRRLWEQVVEPESQTVAGVIEAKPSPVKRIQLMGQPNFFRGKRVQIEGWVRSARMRKVAQPSSLPFTSYYELWLRPKDTNAGTYCVYASNLPEGFPKLDESFQDLNQAIKVEGRFFKLQSFVAGDRSVDYSPALLTNQIQLVEETRTASNETQPVSFSWLLPALVALPLIAGGLAWLAFRSSEPTAREPGKSAQKRLSGSLEQLKDDPDIETDAQRIERLKREMESEE